jgi:phosphoribosyl-ATP pyrophosphohydrolase
MSNKQYKQVEDWAKAFNLFVSEKFEIPVEKEKNLAFNLIKEELAETEKAADSGDLIEVADGFADLLWVLLRAMQQFGLNEELLENVFDEVSRSNNSKACSTMDEAIETQNKYLYEKQIESKIEERGGKFFVYGIGGNVDGKLLKSISYSPADIKPIIGNGTNYRIK